jgi:hypothetical protein
MQSKLLLLLLFLNALPIFDKHLAAAGRRLSCFHCHPGDSPPVLRIVGKIMIWVNKKASPNAIYEQQQPINPKPIVATKCASERANVVAQRSRGSCACDARDNNDKRLIVT